MQIETSAYVNPTARGIVQDQFVLLDQTNMSCDTRLLTNGKESLAASSDAAILQKALVKLTQYLYFEWQAADWSATSWLLQLYPILVDESGFGQEETEVLALASGDRERLLHSLHSTFEAEPIEDGMDHPAEGIIEEALLSKEDPHILKWLKDFSLDYTQPVFAASVLRCLGRQGYPGTSLWRSELVREALALDDVEIRDAAVQSVELWGDREILPVLESHPEPEQWLQDYICDVIEDLGG